jgi:hypothetical protein
VALSGFAVVQEHSEQPDAVLITCFDGAQTLRVFISREVIDNYFRRQDLTALQRDLLVMRNLDKLALVISGRYERGEVSSYASPTGRAYARIDLTLADLNAAPRTLTDSVLDVAARARRQGTAPAETGSDNRVAPQTTLKPPVAGTTKVQPGAVFAFPLNATAFNQSPHFGFGEGGDAAGFGQAPFADVDFSDIDAARTWLDSQSRDVLVAIAARAALRVFPLIVDTYLRSGSQAFASGLALPVFRAAATAWFAARYPPDRKYMRNAAAVKAAETASIRLADTAATVYAVDAAAHATRAVAEDPVKSAEATLYAASGASDCIASDTSARTQLLAAIAADTFIINATAGQDSREAVGIEVTGKPLWPGEIPAWAADAWAQLRAALKREEEDWEVWLDWYEDRLAGRASRDPALDRALASFYEELWAQGPRAVNATIRELLDKSSPQTIPPQGAGPHFTIGSGNRIILAPPSELDVSGNNVPRIKQLLPLVRRAVDDLFGNLNRNTFPELSRDVAQYREAIAGEEDKIAWGTVFGLGVMLENAADAAQRQIADRNLPSLEDAEQAALETVLTLHGPLLLATAEGRELMEQADWLRLTREEQETLRADAQLLAQRLRQKPNLIEAKAANTVAEAADLIGNGPHTERGTIFGLVTIQHAATILVPAGVLAAFGALIGSSGGPIGTVIGGAIGGAGSFVLRESERVCNAARALGSGYDRLVEDTIGQAELVKAQAIGHLRALTPFRDFIRENEEPLRRIANSSRRLRWTLGYIDFVIHPYKDKGDEQQHDVDPNYGDKAVNGVMNSGDTVNVTSSGKTVGPARIVDAGGDQISVIIERTNRIPTCSVHRALSSNPPDPALGI